MEKLNKKWLSTSAALLLLVFGVMFGIYSYLSDTDSEVNTFVIGAVNTAIEEDFTPPDKLEPGISFTKDVKVTNVGPTDCYVRIKAVFTDSDMDKLCDVDWNTTDFVYNEDDGYYYYIEELKVGDSTPSLFTTVTVKETFDKDGDGVDDELTLEDMKDFDIIIYQEAYQSTYNNPDALESRKFNDYIEAWAHYRRNNPNN